MRHKNIARTRVNGASPWEASARGLPDVAVHAEMGFKSKRICSAGVHGERIERRFGAAIRGLTKCGPGQSRWNGFRDSETHHRTK